ncbi:MAG: four helix bundle protein [Clostridia bacterium]|nr:four helix bundle protein [Clostridia bacterium]
MGRVINDFEDLIVWQKAHKLVLQIYELTRNFPKNEEFGLVIQLRRSAASIPSNIAEGVGSNSKVNFKRMLYIARGSLLETRYHLILARVLNYINRSVYEDLKNKYDEVGKMLNSLIKSLDEDNFR